MSGNPVVPFRFGHASLFCRVLHDGAHNFAMTSAVPKEWEVATRRFWVKLMRGATRFGDVWGVDTSRFEMLTLIALVGATFGPAKIKVRDTSSLANYDFELTAAGTLAIQTGETYIPETVLRADIGYRVFFDVALSIIPALLTAYRRDRTWGNEGRDDFIRFCRQQLSGP